MCITCGIGNAHGWRLARFDFVVGGQKVFGCVGCLKALPLDQETNEKPIIKDGHRWCKTCWPVMRNYQNAELSFLALTANKRRY